MVGFLRFGSTSAASPSADSDPLEIEHAGISLPVTFVRSIRARRASLRVDPAHRRIVLTAPMRMSRAVAVGFAESQAGWIPARLKPLPPPPPFPHPPEPPPFRPPPPLPPPPA